MKKLSRRSIIKFGMLSSSIAGALGIGSSFGKLLGVPTPNEVEGPFYPVVNQKDKDADLTKIRDCNGIAEGEHIIITGKVTDVTGSPVKNAMIDIWQANASGRYRHPRDPNSAPLDPNFQGWAIIVSGENGMFRFKTVMPGSYPVTKTWTRPPHIHFKVSRRDYTPLITQMYFPDEGLNETDLLLNNKRASERPLMIAKKTGKENNRVVYEYNIALEKI